MMEEDAPSPSSSPSPPSPPSHSSSPPPRKAEGEEDFGQVIHEAADQLNRVRGEIATLDHLLKERFLKNAAYRTPASVPLQLIHKMDELSLALHSAIDNLGHYFAFSQKHNLDLETNTCGFLGVLPHELILLVLSFLPPKELLLTISVLNRQLRQLVLDNSLWRSLCFYYFGKRALHEEELQQQNVCSQYEEDDDDEDDDEDVGESSTRKEYLLGGGRKRRKRLKRGRSTSREMHKLPATTETNKDIEKEKEREENASDKSSEKMAAVVPTRRKEWRAIFVKQCKLERNWRLGNCSVTTLLSDRRAYCIQFSEEKRQLWSGNAKGVLARWDLDTGNFHADMKAHDGAVNCIQLGRKHRDEQQIRRRKTNKTKKHKKSKQQTREQEEGGDEEAERGTDELLYTCSCDRTIKVWSQSFESINTKRYLRAVFGSKAGRTAAQQTNSNVTTNDDSHGNSVQMIRVNEKSNQLISCSLDMTLKLWDLQRGGEMSTTSSSSTPSGKCIRTFHDVSTLRCLQMDEESGYILSGGSDGCIKVWDGRVPPRSSLASSSSGEESDCVAYFQTGLTKVMAMQFNLKRNINKLIVAGDDGPSGEFSVHIYDLRRTSQPVVSVPVFSPSEYFSSSPPPSHYAYRSSGSPTSHISSSSASSNLSSFPYAGTSPSSLNSFSLSSLTSLSPLRKPPLSSVPSSSVALPPAPSSSGYLYPPFHHATSPHHSHHHHHHHPNRHNHHYRPLFHPHRSSMFPSGSPTSSSSTTKLLASSEENDDEEIEDDENENENENDEHDEDTKIKEDEEEEEEKSHNSKCGLSLGDNSYFKSQSLVGHRDRIWSLQFDFNRLVTGSRDNSVRVWSPLNFTSRDASSSLMSEDFWANSSSQSKEEKEERNKGRGKREWRVPTSYELGHPMQRHINSIYWLQFSSQRLVTASADHTLKIWNFAVDLNEAASDREEGEEEASEEEEEEREYASFTPSFTSLF